MTDARHIALHIANRRIHLYHCDTKKPHISRLEKTLAPFSPDIFTQKKTPSAVWIGWRTSLSCTIWNSKFGSIPTSAKPHCLAERQLVVAFRGYRVNHHLTPLLIHLARFAIIAST
jgi:hypothetical protein